MPTPMTIRAHRAGAAVRRALAGVLASAALAGCSTEVVANAIERDWSVLQENIAGGMLMAAAIGDDGLPLVVGGQADMGAAWALKDGALHELPVPAGKLLTWVSLGADGKALAVGNGRRALWHDPKGSWSAEALPGGDELWGCFALHGGDAWAVGADAVGQDKVAPRLLHRHAAGWEVVALPTLGADQLDARLFKIDGHGPDDLLVVGEYGLALHYDGKAWKVENTGVSDRLVTVRRMDGGRYAIVGGLAQGVVLVRGVDGVYSKVHDGLVGLSGVDAFGDTLIASGDYGWIDTIDLATGKVTELDEPLTTDVLHFVLRLPGGDALAGGGNFLAAPQPMRGTLLRWAP